MALNVKSNGVSSFVNCTPIAASSGASFCAVTVNTNVSSSVPPSLPSSTVTVIFAVPLQLSAGVNVNVVPSTTAVTFSSSDDAV